MEKEYQNIEQEFWNPEKAEDSISGFYLSIQKEVGENKSNVYNLEVEPGKIVSLWGHTVLDNKMKLVKIGDDIRIIYLGEKEGARKYKDFKVQIAKK